VTTDTTSLDQWLSDATRDLTEESAAQVRAEIQQHYDSACEAGQDALAGLGDPRAANRAYRKVLLTVREARMAPVFTQGKRPSILKILHSSLKLAIPIWWLSRWHDGSGWPITISIFCTTPLEWFFFPTTLERTHIYLYVRALRNILAIGVAWWYASWMSALVLGAALVYYDYFTIHTRLSIFRKLGLRR
jgi:hypothetical protein